MGDKGDRARLLGGVLAGAMALQSVLGLLFRQEYRDVEWIALTWLGNDLVNLFVALPLLIVALLLSRRSGPTAYLPLLGMFGFGVYNYAYYMLGATLNRFFALYLLAFIVSAVGLIAVLSLLDPVAAARSFSPRTPARTIGGYLVFVGVALTMVWLGMWFAYAFLGTSLPIDPDPFRLVAALDTALMVPLLVSGGWLLWRKAAWGYVLASLAAIQGALYLLVLTVNSSIAISRRLVEPPSELPVWGPLLLFTAASAVALMWFARPQAPAIALVSPAASSDG